MSEDDGSQRWKERAREYERTHGFRYGQHGEHQYVKPSQKSIRERLSERLERSRTEWRERREAEARERTDIESERKRGRLEGRKKAAYRAGYRESVPPQAKAPKRTRPRTTRRRYVEPRASAEDTYDFLSPFEALDANPFLGGQRGRRGRDMPNPFI